MIFEHWDLAEGHELPIADIEDIFPTEPRSLKSNMFAKEYVRSSIPPDMCYMTNFFDLGAAACYYLGYFFDKVTQKEP